MPKPDWTLFTREQLIEALELQQEIIANLRATAQIRDAMDKYIPILKDLSAEAAAEKVVQEAMETP